MIECKCAFCQNEKKEKNDKDLVNIDKSLKKFLILLSITYV